MSKPKSDEARRKAWAKKSMPGTFNAAKKGEFLELYARGGTVRQVCKAIKISPVTVFNHVRKDEEFGDQFRAALEANTDQLEDKLHDMALSGNTAAVFGTLKARRPAKWGRYELTGPEGKPIQIERIVREVVPSPRHEPPKTS